MERDDLMLTKDELVGVMCCLIIKAEYKAKINPEPTSWFRLLQELPSVFYGTLLHGTLSAAPETSSAEMARIVSAKMTIQSYTLLNGKSPLSGSLAGLAEMPTAVLNGCAVEVLRRSHEIPYNEIPENPFESGAMERYLHLTQKYNYFLPQVPYLVPLEDRLL